MTTRGTISEGKEIVTIFQKKNVKFFFKKKLWKNTTSETRRTTSETRRTTSETRSTTSDKRNKN